MTGLPPLSPSKAEVTGAKVRTALRLRVRAAGTVTQSGVRTRYFEVIGCRAVGHRREMYQTAISDREDHACECYADENIPDRWLAVRRMRGCSHVVATLLTIRRQDAFEKLRLDRIAADRLRMEQAQAQLDSIPPIDHPMFGRPPIPSRFTSFRPHQWRAIEEIAGLYDDGAKVVMWQAPPGSGKTLAGEAIGRLVGGQRLYICTTKTLQKQAEDDFPYAKRLMGRSNYPTLEGNVDAWGRDLNDGTSALTANDCTATPGNPSCRWCDPVVLCPYRRARTAAQTAHLAILNTSYALTDWGKGGGLFRGRRLAIFDEADRLESELLNQVEIVITKWRRERLGMASPAYKTLDEKRGRGPVEAWMPWLTEEAIPKVTKALLRLPPLEDGTTRQIRARKGLERLLEGLLVLQAQLPEGGWVYDGYKQGNIIFRPIQVHDWGLRYIWGHAQRFLLMSGTIISADEMASSLGVPPGYEFVDTPMTFPAKNRPINIVALVEMRRKDAETAWPKMLQGIRGVLNMHPEERILIHTVNYQLAEFLVNGLSDVDRGIYTYRRAEERELALAMYKADPSGVMVGASLERGVDLPDDLCRVVVWAKIPFGDLSDKRTSERLYNTPTGESWYAINTIRAIQQGTQRHIRSETDYGVTYILDHQFTTIVWKKSRRYLSKWWCDAVDWHYPARRITHPDG